ncbi:hypothetical protein E2C01_059517 [Portunus trituberculatus]|uniref:Uncharacterized protein n=1 Tax=Portunus trituberculatus TaxID=210409 RepID=A0A5B7H2S2_PORTR|nr:hypothetical protein [Portunus trituberculatus]
MTPGTGKTICPTIATSWRQLAAIWPCWEASPAVYWPPMCRASGTRRDETAQVNVPPDDSRAACAAHHVESSRQRQASCGAGVEGQRAEEALSELKPVRRISRRPCVTVQPSHLWCCFASPQRETVVGHVASGRQLGGGQTEGGGGGGGGRGGGGGGGGG